MTETNERLHLGAVLGKTDMMREAITEGADPNSRDSSGLTPLGQAIIHLNPHVFEVLFENGVSPNSFAIDGNPAIVLACGVNLPSILNVATLVRWGADVNVRGGQGYTPLCIAVENDNVELIKYLLENGADPDMATAYGLTPLMLAARDGLTEAAGLLIERGATKETVGPEGIDAMAYAIKYGHQETASLLAK